MLISDQDWFSDLRETHVGQVFPKNMERERARQLQQINDTGIPWLLEPEHWLPQ